jgi:N-glycosylase/DNA lyase
MTVKGVGEKVANCVLLYSLGRTDAFPVDVWMKRICEEMYFHKDTPKDVIEREMCQKFGNIAGIAQQYLFIYGKEKNIGK